MATPDRQPYSGGMVNESEPERPVSGLVEQLNRDLKVESLQRCAHGSLDLFFLVYLRRLARFGYFTLGPITIDVRLIESIVDRTIVPSTPRGITDDYVRFSKVLMEEVQRSGQKRIDELHFLLAFMRCGEGLPARVFGELAVTPEQVVQYLKDRGGDGAPEPAEPPERLMTPEQAAAYLQVHVETVRNWIRAGTLPARRVAGLRALRIRAADIEALLKPLSDDEPEAPRP